MEATHLHLGTYIHRHVQKDLKTKKIKTLTINTADLFEAINYINYT